MNSALWVVATPLGNLGDISSRAVSVLKKAEVILAEDTRRAGRLLQGLDISGKRLLSLHEHNEDQRISQVVKNVDQGMDCCLISDAGTPLMADPGYRLVRAFRKKGLPVIPVPGPCAPVTALMASGIAPYPFSFLGFVPRKKGELEALFTRWKDVPTTLVFFERKNRVSSCLEVACRVLGPREFCLARELTKKFEEFIFGVLGSTEVSSQDLLGEITIVLGPPDREPSRTDPARVLELIREYRDRGHRPRKLVGLVQAGTSGWTSKEIYDLVVRGDN